MSTAAEKKPLPHVAPAPKKNNPVGKSRRRVPTHAAWERGGWRDARVFREQRWPATTAFPHPQKWEPGGAASLPGVFGRSRYERERLPYRI